MCLYDGYEIKKNQEMIMVELVNCEVVHLSLDRTHIDELCDMMRTMSDLNQDESNINAFVLFNMHLVMLIVNCTVGKNTFTEIKSHAILSLDDIERVVSTDNCFMRVKQAYIKLLYNAHIDTENETKEIITQPYIWAIFDNFTRDIAMLVKDSEMKQDKARYLMESYVLDTIVEVVIGFFSHNQFNYIPSPQVCCKAFFFFCVLFDRFNLFDLIE